ncbi:MAG: FkbM family methyltransferase [Methylobacter sp.]
MGILNTLGFILNHPLNANRKLASMVRFAHWQIGSRLVGAPVVKHFVDRTRLLVSPGMTGATQNIYCGLHEFEDMSFVLHALRETDGFVDVGANIGSYTVLAGGVVGACCVSVEPIPGTFRHLLDNINLNGIGDLVVALNVGIGQESGSLRFTSKFDTVNHVLTESEEDGGSIDVKMEKLDDVLSDFEPRIIKIDVEGFEADVIAGADKVLSRKSLFAVIMELNGSGERYGVDEDHLHKRMLEYGFRTFSYLPFERRLVVLDGKNVHSGNTLYIRNEEEVLSRLRSAQKFMTNLGIEV